MILDSCSYQTDKKGHFMKSTLLKFSKSRIDKAGQKLKSADLTFTELEENLDVLSNWRAYHAGPLDTFAKVLKNRVKRVSATNEAIVAQRLKRTSSILLKLNTHSTMRLSAMQDIGGLRAILISVDQVFDLFEIYRISRSKHKLVSVDNYIDRPKRDGYRGIHIIYKLKKNPSLFIEIQIRSHLQHIWATGVEVLGTLQKSSFKSGHGDKDWLRFFRLLSSVFALKESSKKLENYQALQEAKLLTDTKKMIKEMKVIEKLSAYTSLYKKELHHLARGRKGNYSLILLDSELNVVSVETFSAESFDLAESAYIRLERKHFKEANKNVVLVNSGDLKKLEVGYPNYFMDTGILVKNLSLIILDEFLNNSE